MLHSEEDERSVEAFLARLPAASTVDGPSRRALARLLARSGWPGVHLPEDRWLDHLALSVGDRPPVAALRALHLSDFYLCVACAEGDTAALRALDLVLVSQVRRVLDRLGVAHLEDEVLSLVRQRVMVDNPPRPAKLRQYSGKGALEGWLRAVTVSVLRKVAPRVSRERDLLDELTDHIAPGDLELGLLKSRHRAQLRESLEGALRQLQPVERNLLRLAYVEDLSTEALGKVYGVHKSTAARRLRAIEQTLREQSLAGLSARLHLNRTELTSLLRALISELSLSLPRALDDGPAIAPVAPPVYERPAE